MVRRILSPLEVMKSIVNSTLFLSAHSWQILRIGSSAVGTQWSQNPQESLPAAWAPRTNGAAMTTLEAAAAVRSTARLVKLLGIFPPKSTAGIARRGTVTAGRLTFYPRHFVALTERAGAHQQQHQALTGKS